MFSRSEKIKAETLFEHLRNGEGQQVYEMLDEKAQSMITPEFLSSCFTELQRGMGEYIKAIPDLFPGPVICGIAI